MFRTVLVVVAAMACVQARPQATGESLAGITKGETIGPAGSSTIVNQEAKTQGQAFLGSTNFGSAGAFNQAFKNPFGSGSSGATDTKSEQTGGFPSIPGFNFGSAAGFAGSKLTEGLQVNPDGSSSRVTSLNSSAGGKAEGGGTNKSGASGSTTTVNGVGGTQTQSQTSAESSQTGR